MSDSEEDVMLVAERSLAQSQGAQKPQAGGSGLTPTGKCSSSTTEKKTRQAVDYFRTFYQAATTERRVKDGSSRKWTYRSAHCKLYVTKTSTLGKEINGWDTYANFERHFESLHRSTAVRGDLFLFKHTFSGNLQEAWH